MNYLAHLFLSCESIELMVGNFITDQITLKEAKEFSGRISEGIELHKSIDSFTDNHPVIKDFISFIRPTQGKYSPVVVDVYCDYILYSSWDQYSHWEFTHFEDLVYENLLSQKDVMPDRIQQRVINMVKSRWLQVYTHQAGMTDTFRRIGHRVKFDNQLSEATSFLFENKETCQEYFNQFFPDLINHVNAICEC